MCSTTLGVQRVSPSKTPLRLQERKIEQLLNVTKAGKGQTRPRPPYTRAAWEAKCMPSTPLPKVLESQMCLACQGLKTAFVLCSHI